MSNIPWAVILAGVGLGLSVVAVIGLMADGGDW